MKERMKQKSIVLALLSPNIHSPPPFRLIFKEFFCPIENVLPDGLGVLARGGC
jgi:hypothetical protein